MTQRIQAHNKTARSFYLFYFLFFKEAKTDLQFQGIKIFLFLKKIINKEKPTAWCKKYIYLFHFVTYSCMCHCVVPECIIKKPTIRVTWQATRIARVSRVLKDQNKSESRLEFCQVSNGKKRKQKTKTTQLNKTTTKTRDRYFSWVSTLK